MLSSSCTRNEALYTFESCLLPALRYAMPVTTISYNDWNHILAPALTPSLQKAGVSKNAPRAVLFGPKSLHGLGLPHPYFQQQICHVETLLQQVISGTQTGTILRASAEQFRLELGFPFCINTCTFKPYSSYITNSWYKDLWQFLSKSAIRITEDFPDPPPLRRGDKFLMPIFARAGYRGKQLRILNEVRLFLRALTVADIASADGARVQHFAYNLTRPSTLRPTYAWPTPIPINAHERNLWTVSYTHLTLPTKA